MRSRFHMSALLGAALASLSPAILAEPPPVRPPPRARDPFDAPRWARNKKRKAERAAARQLKRAGISGAGLWRKTGNRSVRGW